MRWTFPHPCAGRLSVSKGPSTLGRVPHAFSGKADPTVPSPPKSQRWDPQFLCTLIGSNDLEVARAAILPVMLVTLPAVRMPSVEASRATQGGNVSSGTHGFDGGNIASQVGNVTSGAHGFSGGNIASRGGNVSSDGDPHRTPTPRIAAMGPRSQQGACGFISLAFPLTTDTAQGSQRKRLARKR